MGVLDNIFGANWIADLFNPHHQPAGTPVGGQFAPATGGASGGMGGQTTAPSLETKRAAAAKRLHEWQNNTDRGFESNADWNGALNIAERFGDAELNHLPFSAVKPLLEQRYQARFPATRSVAAAPGSAPAMAATANHGQPVQLTPGHSCL